MKNNLKPKTLIITGLVLILIVVSALVLPSLWARFFKGGEEFLSRIGIVLEAFGLLALILIGMGIAGKIEGK